MLSTDHSKVAQYIAFSSASTLPFTLPDCQLTKHLCVPESEKENLQIITCNPLT